MIVIISGGIALDVLKSSIFTTRTVAADLATKVPTVEHVASFWTNLVDALLYTHGGLMANWLVLGLGFLAVLALRFGDRFERLLVLWIAVPSIPFLVLDSYSQARILYDLPIPILTSMATAYLLPQIATKSIRWLGPILLLLIVATASYALQGLLNL